METLLAFVAGTAPVLAAGIVVWCIVVALEKVYG